MKHLVSIIVGIVITLPMLSQTKRVDQFDVPWQVRMYTNNTGYHVPILSRIDNPVQHDPGNYKKITYHHKNKKREKTTVSEFNENKDITALRYTNKNGKWINKLEIEYNDRGYYQKVTLFNHRNKMRLWADYAYDESGLPISRTDYNKRGKQTDKGVRIYNENGCVDQVQFYGKNDRQTHLWKYSYQSECQLAEFFSYNKKGKLLSHVDYNCDQEGERIKADSKWETNYCTWKETENDYLVEITERTDKKGRVIRTIRKYSLPDTALVEIKSFDKKDRLNVISTYAGSHDMMLTYRKVKHNGKLRNGSNRSYDDQKRLVIEETVRRNGEIKNRYEYDYNEANYITSIRYYYKDGLESTTKVEYEL
ncbi:MAG: hypothetical protein R2813_09725 [Flavobacteriales bacterium]